MSHQYNIISTLLLFALASDCVCFRRGRHGQLMRKIKNFGDDGFGYWRQITLDMGIIFFQAKFKEIKECPSNSEAVVKTRPTQT